MRAWVMVRLNSQGAREVYVFDLHSDADFYWARSGQAALWPVVWDAATSSRPEAVTRLLLDPPEPDQGQYPGLGRRGWAKRLPSARFRLEPSQVPVVHSFESGVRTTLFGPSNRDMLATAATQQEALAVLGYELADPEGLDGVSIEPEF